MVLSMYQRTRPPNANDDNIVECGVCENVWKCHGINELNDKEIMAEFVVCFDCESKAEDPVKDQRAKPVINPTVDQIVSNDDDKETKFDLECLDYGQHDDLLNVVDPNDNVDSVYVIDFEHQNKSNHNSQPKVEKMLFIKYSQFNDMNIEIEYRLLNKIIDVKKYVIDEYKHKARLSFFYKNMKDLHFWKMHIGDVV